MNSKIISFAIEAHANTNHLYDGKPYSVHLSMVVANAYRFIDCISIAHRSDVISACWLHDTIEDCRLTYNDVKLVAGVKVADIVYAVTNEKGRNRKERANNAYYHGIRITSGATFVKLCDRLANVQYSYETNSRMFSVYQKENESFLKSLFVEEKDMVHYREIIGEIKNLLAKDY